MTSAEIGRPSPFRSIAEAWLPIPVVGDVFDVKGRHRDVLGKA